MSEFGFPRPVTIEILQKTGGEFPGYAVSLSGAGIVFEAPVALPELAPVKLTWDRYALLCEVIAQRPAGGVMLTEALVHHVVDLDKAAECSRYWS